MLFGVIRFRYEVATRYGACLFASKISISCRIFRFSSLDVFIVYSASGAGLYFPQLLS
jgi:hypothetical protein